MKAKEIINWVVYFVCLLAVVFVINTFVVQRTMVSGDSMYPYLHNKDQLMMDKLSYRFHDPERFDIIVFPFQYQSNTYYIKRIIGMPGDTIDIVDGKVYLNGSDTPLDEPYLHEPMEPEEPQHYEVPDGCYFMLGDNRNYSNAARRWTHKYVKRDNLVAKVLFQYFPKIQKLN